VIAPVKVAVVVCASTHPGKISIATIIAAWQTIPARTDFIFRMSVSSYHMFM
jgi:hypothetical protein